MLNHRARFAKALARVLLIVTGALSMLMLCPALRLDIDGVTGANAEEAGRMDRVTPKRTEDLLGILGVGGQIAANFPAYLDVEGVVADARFVGARHFRDSLSATSARQLPVLKALAQAGISLVAFPPNSGSATPTHYQLRDLLSAARTFAGLGPHALFALEGPNEPGNFPIIYNGAIGGGTGSFLSVAQFQRDWYAAIKADTVLARVPVYTTTLGGAETDNVGLQYARIPAGAGTLMPDDTIMADVLNFHSYPVFSGSAQTIDPVVGDVLSLQLAGNFVRTFRGHYSGYTLSAARALPKAITEFGLHTKKALPGLGMAVDVQTQGKNILTALLNSWSDGYELLSIYELYDEGDGFGIFSASRLPRESATYLHNFTSALRDPAPDAATFTPTPIQVAVGNLPISGRWQVFETARGKYFVVLWNNVTNYDVISGGTVGVPVSDVTVSFAKPGVIFVRNPVQSIDTIAASQGVDVHVALTDHPMIVQFAPD